MSEPIKLPPLPSPGETMSKWAYDEQDMQAYARAAIEADRQASGEPVLGPFTLDDESYEPGFRDINRPGHPGFMRVVWKMEDDDRSPECEKVAHFVIDALNAADGQARGEANPPKEKDLWPNGSLRYFCDRCDMTLGADVVMDIANDFRQAAPEPKEPT